MKLSDMRFKITDKKKNITCIVGWDRIYGYEGEECGVFVRLDESTLSDLCLTSNSGYGFEGINEDIDIEVMSVGEVLDQVVIKETELTDEQVEEICIKKCGTCLKMSDGSILCIAQSCPYGFSKSDDAESEGE